VYSYLLEFAQIHDDFYVITKPYLELIKQTKDNCYDTICLLGPKGCGKSITLVALLLHLQKSKDAVLYITTDTIRYWNTVNVRGYANMLIREYYNDLTDSKILVKVSEVLQSRITFIEFLRDYIDKFSKDRKVYLLMDFCHLKECNEEEFESLFSVSCIQRSRLQVVVAISSGEGRDLSSFRSRENLMSMISRGKTTIYFNGFTEAEAQKYLTCNKKVDFDDVKPYSGYNPLLLSLYSNNCIISEYAEKVKRTVLNFIEHNLQINEKNVVQMKFMVQSLEQSTKYFYMANQQIPMSNDDAEYTNTWMYRHRVLIKEGNLLRLNFPTLPPALLSIIEDLLPLQGVRELCSNPIVEGFLFEAEFFRSFQSSSILLDVVCCSVQIPSKLHFLEFSPVVQKLDVPLTTMNVGFLYQLRARHPQIDGLGLLCEEKQKKQWLVFVQVSISLYKDHKSKLSKLTHVCQQRPQELSKVTGRTTLFSYYKNIAKISEDTNILFLYISTAEVYGESTTTVLPDLRDEFTKEQGIVTRQRKDTDSESAHVQNIYIGLLRKQSTLYNYLINKRTL